MNTRATFTRLYDACDFNVKPLMAHRALGFGADALRETMSSVAPSSIEKKTHDDIFFERKMWRARRVARFISLLPFVRGVAVCNSLAFHMVHEVSDVDLFIIAAAGRVWSARWWVTGTLALLRMRPGEAARDPVCVSFFVDERVDDLSNVMIERDVYFYFWLRTLMPIFGEHILFLRGARTAPEFRVTPMNFFQRTFEFFARVVSEKFVHRQQLAIMPRDVRPRGDTSIVLTDTIIKLHQNDRRTELRDRVCV